MNRIAIMRVPAIIMRASRSMVTVVRIWWCGFEDFRSGGFCDEDDRGWGFGSEDF